MQYRRVRTEGGTYFFTAVTHKRRKILCNEAAIELLREAFRAVMARHAFSIEKPEGVRSQHLTFRDEPQPEGVRSLWNLLQGRYQATDSGG
ncbi:MAG: hypothetical protein U1D97_01145, partial [Desulfuromonadales bacterium]|nr:hypothetical protein [Desulfuromonadales bacterium]